MATAPPSWPRSSAAPRIGVSARRLRKPVSTSRARSVPAVAAANSAPCMNANGRKKSRKCFVGKPGRCVAERSPLEFTAISISGNVSGAITDAGWRMVRTTDRRAISPICLSRRNFTARSRRHGLRLLLAGALERAARLGEEDVVERGRVQLDVLQAQSLGVERAHHVGQVARAVEADARSAGPGLRLLAEPLEHRGDRAELAGIL